MRSVYLVAAMALITVTTLQTLQMHSSRGETPTAKRLPVVKRPAPATVPQADADDPKSLNRKAILLHSQARYNEALPIYRQALSLEPDNAAYHNNIALLLKDMDLLPEAEKEAQTAISLNPKRADYYFNLGLILHKRQKFSRAQGKLSRAVQLEPKDAEFRYVLGQVLFDRGLAHRAEDAVRWAIQLRPSEPKYHRLLADALLRQDKHEEALAEYDKTMSLSPRVVSNRAVANKIEYLKRLIGQSQDQLTQ